MRNIFLAILFLACAGISAGQQNGSASHFDGNSWWAHVKFLADDSLEGRDTGSEGLRKAQAYAVEQFQKAGLEPAGTNGFYQPIRFNQYEVDESKSSLALVTNGQVKTLSFADDAFISSRATRTSATLSAPLVFIGYGLQIPEKNLDELAGLDLKGKIVVYLAGSPSDIPTALASHYQTAGERWKSLHAAGAIGTINIFNPASMDIPWSRTSPWPIRSKPTPSSSPKPSNPPTSLPNSPVPIPLSRTNSSSSPRISTMSASARPSTAIASTTAQWTMAPAALWSWISPRAWKLIPRRLS